MKNKLSNILVSAGFLIFLMVAMAVTLLRGGETYSYFENRNLTKMPETAKDKILSGEYFSGVEDYLRDHAAARNTLLKFDTYANIYLLHRPVVNETVILDDILLPWNDYETIDTLKMEERAQNMADNLRGISDRVEAYGGVFYYVAVPCQYSYFSDEYPWYMNNRKEFIEATVPVLEQKLSENGVNYIDMGYVFDDMGHPARLSSFVDNHYSMEGAYLTYVEIMEAVNRDTGYDLNILREGDYTMRELPNHYLGSRLRKIFNLWNCDETLSIIEPKEAVPFLRYDNGAQSASVVYSMPQNDWEWALYSLYMGGDVGETVIDTGRNDLPDLMVYGDSFTNAAETILWNGFNEMRSVDRRYYTGGKTFGEYIDEYKPEVVVCIRDYSALVSTWDNGVGADN